MPLHRSLSLSRLAAGGPILSLVGQQPMCVTGTIYIQQGSLAMSSNLRVGCLGPSAGIPRAPWLQ